LQSSPGLPTLWVAFWEISHKPISLPFSSTAVSVPFFASPRPPLSLFRVSFSSSFWALMELLPPPNFYAATALSSTVEGLPLDPTSHFERFSLKALPPSVCDPMSPLPFPPRHPTSHHYPGQKLCREVPSARKRLRHPPSRFQSRRKHRGVFGFSLQTFCPLYVERFFCRFPPPRVSLQ